MASETPTLPIATVNNPTPAANEYFGTAVAIAGTRVVVGADWENTGASRSGSAYIYQLTSATPTVPIYALNNPTPGTDDRFGAAVAISGTRVVVAALSDDLAQQNAGSVYVYELTSASPTVPAVTLFRHSRRSFPETMSRPVPTAMTLVRTTPGGFTFTISRARRQPCR